MFHLLIVQIILSVAKLLTVGPMESIVGTLSYSGGAYASVYPMLGFSFLWMYREGVLSKKDWIIVLGLFLIGLVNYKRAVWFILPMFIFIFTFYVQDRKSTRLNSSH